MNNAPLAKGSFVVFPIKSTRGFYSYKIGVIRVVDKYNEKQSFYVKESVSVDIFVEAENCLYKHIPYDHVNTIPSFVLFLRSTEITKERRNRLLREFARENSNMQFNINISDYFGNTILHVPEILVKPDLVSLAFELGARMIQNKEGLLPTDIAKKLGCEEALSIIAGCSNRSTNESLSRTGIRCTNCGKFVGMGLHYCPWCRMIIDYAERPLVRPDYDVEETMSFCKHCGAPTRFAHKFCGICGEPL